MDIETKEMLQVILSEMKKMEDRLNQKLENSSNNLLEIIQQQAETTQIMINDSERRMKTYIENDVGKRIDTLFDGYKLAHEKQWELEHETAKLKEQVNDLQTRLAALEKKVSA